MVQVWYKITTHSGGLLLYIYFFSSNYLVVLECLPAGQLNGEPDSKAEFTTHKCFPYDLCYYLKCTKISETSCTSKFLEYTRDIPEVQKHSLGIESVILELNVMKILVIESQI